MGTAKRTPIDRSKCEDDFNTKLSKCSNEGTSDSKEQFPAELQKRFSRLECESEGSGFGLMNKSKRKRNRRKERKNKKHKNVYENLKIIGVNCAGLMSKIQSFEKLLNDENPTIFCLQETKIKKPNQIKTETSKNFTLYELHRKNSNGGGLCIGVNKDLRSVWISQGDYEVEALTVEIWADDFPVRIVTAYGPQLCDSQDRKQNFWQFLEREVANADEAGAGFILQMDSNCHLGKNFIEKDVNEQNSNGKLFGQFLERNTQLTLINSLSLCEGLITRMRKTTRGLELSILDVFVTCNKILPYIKQMKIDEKREKTLSNFGAMKAVGRVIETDHNPLYLEVSLKFSPVKPERVELFNFKNIEAQKEFKTLTTNTNQFTNCFMDDSSFEKQAAKWRKTLTSFFHKAFKKVRISNKSRKKNTTLSILLDRRSTLKKKQDLNEKEEMEMFHLDGLIAKECEEENRKKIIENFKDMDGNEGNLNHQGVWQVKRKQFPKIQPTLPVGKKNVQGQIITNPEELKDLYLDTFKFRLRHRPARPGFEDYMEVQEELFNMRLKLAEGKKTPAWEMNDLEEALASLKSGKSRDPEGLIREVFKDEVIGEDLKNSLLILYNKIKDNGKIPSFMTYINISAIYKGKGELNDLDSDRGIFLVSLFRTILMKMIYKDKYNVIEESMSDSNIGARKGKNI